MRETYGALVDIGVVDEESVPGKVKVRLKSAGEVLDILIAFDGE